MNIWVYAFTCWCHHYSNQYTGRGNAEMLKCCVSSRQRPAGLGWLWCQESPKVREWEHSTGRRRCPMGTRQSLHTGAPGCHGPSHDSLIFPPNPSCDAKGEHRAPWRASLWMPQPLELVMEVLASRDRLPAWRGAGSPGVREPPKDKASPRDMPQENDHVQWIQPENAAAQNADPLHTRTPQASQTQCLSYTILTFTSYIRPSSSVDLNHITAQHPQEGLHSQLPEPKGQERSLGKAVWVQPRLRSSSGAQAEHLQGESSFPPTWNTSPSVTSTGGEPSATPVRVVLPITATTVLGISLVSKTCQWEK